MFRSNPGLFFRFVVLFAATCSSALADVAQWDFDGDLESTTGHSALLEQATPAAGTPDFEFVTETIGVVDADVVHFSRGTFFRLLPGVPPNGGGGYVNQYTLVMDVMFPDRSPSGGWASLHQTNETNSNDGDWFINPENAVGISGNYGGSVPEGEWHRLALVVDLVAGTFTSFVDGTQVQQLTGEPLDGRFSLYSINDGGLDGFSLFADESGDDAEGFVNSVQFRDVALPPAEIALLGGPSAGGIPIPTDPRDCSLRNFQVAYDRASNKVSGTWAMLPGENGFRVFQGARQVGGDLPAAATSFEDATPPVSGAGVVYTLKPLRAGGAVERECSSSPVDTFGCIESVACCADQTALSVTLTWQPSVNITVSGFRVQRDGVEIATAGAAAGSYTDGSVTSPGTYLYEVTLLSGGNPVCGASCRTTVTGVDIGSTGGCGAVLNTYDFNGDLKSSTGGRDLIPRISPPIDPVTGSPEVSFEDADIGGEIAKVARYSRGTFFRMFTGFPPNGGGQYTNQFTLIMDLLFEVGALDETGWAALYQTNEVNANDADWYVQGTGRDIGIDGNYGGLVPDDEWNRLALVVDLAAGTFTSYVNGVKVQQNAGQAIDGRFSLYTVNDGDFDGISIFADPSGANSAGLVNSVQIRDRALTDDEIAAFGGPSAQGISPGPPCPSSLTCEVDPASRNVTLGWNKGFGLPGDGFTIRRNGIVLASVPLTADTYTDPDLVPGVYSYELSLNSNASGCLNPALECQTEVPGERIFFEDFDGFEDDSDLTSAGWEIHDVGTPVEDAGWTVTNPGRRTNPPTWNGKPSSGRFVISDSAFGGSVDAQNLAGSGMAYELWSPTFSTAGAQTVWLHFDVAAQLNNDGDAVFEVEVRKGDGPWTTVLQRVSPGRTAGAPTPEPQGNVDGLFGRVHLDLSDLAQNSPAVQIRLRHVEPTWDWWVAVDNVIVDSNPAGGSEVALAEETFDGGIPPTWKVVSGPESDGTDTWGTDDVCSLSWIQDLPDTADGRGLHHFSEKFALIDPVCSPGRADEYLISRPIDISGAGRVFLHVDSVILPTSRGEAEILLSTDGGITFLPGPVFSYSAGGLLAVEEDPLHTNLVIEVPRAAGQTNVAFAFHYKSLGNSSPPGTWWALENVLVTATPASTSPLFHRGDADDNGDLQITDAVRILGFLFLGDLAPPCLDAADADDNGGLQLTDAVRILGYLFLGQVAPAPPGPPTEPCGVDPTEDGAADLGCESYESCP